MLTHTQVCVTGSLLKIAILRHMLSHVGERPHKSNVCQNQFTSVGDLKRHMRKHTGERQHKCDVCPTRFACHSDLKRRMLTHTGKRLHKCDVSHERFARTNLKTHSRIQMQGQTSVVYVRRSVRLLAILRDTCFNILCEKLRECGVCHSRFASYGDLAGHMLVQMRS